jgi:AAA family ATP:ADP antiporter
VYLFFISHIIVFFLLFKSDVSDAYIARVFFVWVSVFNLFIVSVFWSFMTDIYSNGQAKRLFGFIAAGGTIGALFGPILTTALAVPLGLANLLLVSALFLGWALLCVNRLIVWQDAGRVNGSDTMEPDQTPSAERALGGTIWAGIRLVVSSPYLIGICVLMLLFTTLATFLYFQQAEIVRDSFSDSSQRTRVFAAIDLAVNLLTILLQVFLTGRLVKWLGLGWTLAIVPLALAAGFGLLASFPTLGVLVLVQVTRRAGNYAIARPAREMLYVVLDREEKYKAKNFIDTVVYRGGDAVSAWIYSGLRALGLGLSAIAWLAVPIACVWAWIAFRLGKQQEEIAVKQQMEQSGASSRS